MSLIRDQGRQRVVIEKGSQDERKFYSYDWSDNTTWYQNSERVVDEVATCNDSPTYTEYDVVNSPCIDTYHYKLTGEDFLVDSSANSYRMVVQVNDVEKTEQDPHLGTGGDYTVDYSIGRVTFLSALIVSDVVKVTYHHINGVSDSSCFTIKPATGKKLSVNFVEVQFSKNVDLKDSAVFQPYGLVDVFAPQLTPSPYPSGTLIPLGDPTIYHCMKDYLNDSVKAYVEYPAMGGASIRGTSQPVLVMNWEYLQTKVLSSAAGMEIRCSLQHHLPFTGEYATASFYCEEEDE